MSSLACLITIAVASGLAGGGQEPEESSKEAACIEPANDAQITPSPQGNSVVVLKWQAAQDGQSTRLQMSAKRDFSNYLINRVVCCEATVRNLDADRYYWRVLAESKDGRSAEACTASFEVLRPSAAGAGERNR